MNGPRANDDPLLDDDFMAWFARAIKTLSLDAGFVRDMKRRAAKGEEMPRRFLAWHKLYLEAAGPA